MSIVPFKPSIGSKRLPRADRSSEAQFTRSIRNQMKDITANYAGFIKHMEGANAEILYNALKPTFEKSQIRVPKKTGELKKSGYLVTRTFRGRQEVEMGYGRGGNPSYAAIVHEDLRAYHASPTTAKYLEDPINEDGSKIQKRIVEGIRRASGG